jgi:solute:Na+ symporter, SSS family
MTLTFLHLIGLFSTIIAIVIVSILSERKEKKTGDFDGGTAKAGSWIVCGTIMGSVIGGQATIGTAQMAFSYGLTAWWFTLGTGIGCLILIMPYLKPLRRSGCRTLLEIVSKEYGKKSEITGSILCSIGIFISIVAQVIAATAIITAILPVNETGAALLSVFLMTIYVVFGGIWGAGMGGILKIILLYLSCVIGAVTVLGLANGNGGIMEPIRHILDNRTVRDLSEISETADVTHRYISLFARGFWKDFGSAISVVLGILATQTYAQAILAGHDDKTARRGGLLSVFLVPPIGAACILIGMYMRGHYVTQAEYDAMISAGQSIPAGIGVMASSSQAFPLFVMNHIPKLLGGILLGTFLIAVIGGGSGLSFGVATIMVRDIFSRFSRRVGKSLEFGSTNYLKIMRYTIIGILSLAIIVSLLTSGSFINDLGFLSMGLRVTSVFIPVTLALFLKGRFHRQWILISMIAGTLTILLGDFFTFPFDPLFLGISISLICCMIGYKRC